MEIRPVDLPLLRDEWLGDLAEVPDSSPPKTRDRDFIDALRHAVVDTVNEAELFFVTGPMASLAVAAAGSLPDFRVDTHDLPSKSGFLLYEIPITHLDDADVMSGYSMDADVTGVIWNHFDDGLVALAWLGERGVVGLHYFLLNGLVGALVPGSTGCRQALATLKSTWILLGQTLASVEDAHYDRAARRRIEKQGKTPPRVRVISLRRRAGESSGDSDREYHHQWIVRGHWRQQWYPERQVHRPIWIAPHIKGPEGAPLLGGEKVYALKR